MAIRKSAIISKAMSLYWSNLSNLRTLSKRIAFETKLLLSGIGFDSGAAKSLRSWEEQCKQARFQATRAGFTLATKEILSKYKRSDTLFVLGSAPSLNLISDREWEEIGKHDSVGFNFFLAHSFVPTYYHLELTPPQFDIFRSCYSQRQQAYSGLPFMINYLHIAGEITHSDLSFVKNLMVTVPRRYAGTAADDFQKILNFAYRNIEPRDDTYLVHNRASIGLMASLAVMLGYKKIVLIGIDLNSKGHFFCDERYACEAIRPLTDDRCTPEKTAPPAADENFLHITADPKLWPEHITIDKSLEIYAETVLNPRGIELFVYHDSSLLYPAFPLWRWQS